MSGKPKHAAAPEEREPTIAELKARVEEVNRRQKTDGPRPGFIKHVAQVFETSMKLKSAMLKHGVTRARAKCPRCGVVGALQGSLAGRRNHLRMWCETPACSMEAME